MSYETEVMLQAPHQNCRSCVLSISIGGAGGNTRPRPRDYFSVSAPLAVRIYTSQSEVPPSGSAGSTDSNVRCYRTPQRY